MTAATLKMHRLLIANRGEIARRIVRTARNMGLSTVAVFSDADAKALHVHEADAAVALRGNASTDTYLRIDRIIEAARATGADAVHPGYGFLSENADFAQAVVDAGLVWVGPPPQAIRAAGSKSAAKQLALQSGVHVLPGYSGAAQDNATFAREAERVGYPLMVKAVAGGGGRGMRLVRDAASLTDALRSARSEALTSFGNGDLLIERALLAPRHVEVQVFADAHGNCVHLGERDCSVQRRHQKIIEESPSPAVDHELRERMGRAAIAFAQAAGYVGAGTVEFLLQDGAFYLMEMNTRLQVEHPVTELLYGLDLVEWQLRIARGEKLPLAQQDLMAVGHAIEVRLCAEDDDFTPHSGTVLKFKPPAATDGLRFDHALFEGLAVPPYYDSMLGKLIVHASTRSLAVAQLAAALDRLVLLGLPTNRALLAACLRHPVFQQGKALVPFLSMQGEGIREALRAAEAGALKEAGLAAVLGATSSPALQCGYTRPVRLRLQGNGRGAVTEHPVQAVHAIAGVEAERVDPQRLRWHVQHGAVDFFVEDASFDPPASAGGGAAGGDLRAPFNGRVVAVNFKPGDAVRKGDALVVVESMKLEHSLAAAVGGVVESVSASVGQQVAPGQLLASVKVTNEGERGS